MSREGISLIVIQRQLGHADLAITSRYLRGIDNTEIIQAVHQRPEPMIPAGRQLLSERPLDRPDADGAPADLRMALAVRASLMRLREEMVPVRELPRFHYYMSDKATPSFQERHR